MTNRIPVGVFFALFTISGFAGLIYQSIWSHYLKLFLGHAAYAQTLVLAIFMGGMAIGSWLVSRYTHRLRDLLFGYAIAELGIGLLAIVFHGVFQAVTAWAFTSVLPALGGSGVDLFKWTLASVLILPASILLGTTFPLMSAGILRLYPDSGGRALSMLYFTNSFGAAGGVLVSGFYLISKLGLPGTILTAGLLNVLLAFVVWVITKRLPEAPAPQSTTATAPVASAVTFGRVILLLAAVTGAASFIYEITWIRMLTLGLGASTHAFEVMLAAFILGMSLGAYWFRNRIAHLKNDAVWLAGLLAAKAFFAVYAVWIYGDVLDFIQWMMTAVARTDGGYVLVTFAGLIASMIVMLPTAFCAGMTLPLATHALTSRGFGEASIGKVYGANTAGCIVGAAFATHVGMEALGLKGLTGMGAALDIAVGALVLWVATQPERRARAFAAIAVVVVVGIIGYSRAELDLLKMSSGVFRYGVFFDNDTSAVKFYKDGKTATVSVLEKNGIVTIHTNGKPDAGVQFGQGKRAVSDESTMMLAGALPLAMMPEAREVANIGFGSGLTTHLLLGSPNLKNLDSIEIERAMIEGAKFFQPRNARAYGDPRSHVHIEDAKTFFAAHGKKYDVIVSEPSNPWVSGVSTLFSDEFYGQVRNYLKEDGLLIQWIQVYEINVGLVSTVFEALGKNFPDYVVYSTTVGDLIIIASPSGKIPPLKPDLFAMPNVAADLAYLGYRDVNDLAALRIGSRQSLEPLFRSTGYLPNSDFFPILDQQAPLSRFKRESADGLRTLRESVVPLLAMMDGETRTPASRLAQSDFNRTARLQRALQGSEAIGVALTGAAQKTNFLTYGERSAATLVYGLLDKCTDANVDWTDAVQTVFMMSAPYLEAPVVDEFVQKLESSRCYKELDDMSRRRILMFKAINARDAAGMLVQAEHLLNLPSPTLDPDRWLFLMATMTGHLAAGNKAAARTAWEQHSAKLTDAQRSLLSFKLALAHATVGPRPAAATK